MSVSLAAEVAVVGALSRGEVRSWRSVAEVMGWMDEVRALVLPEVAPGVWHDTYRQVKGWARVVEEATAAHLLFSGEERECPICDGCGMDDPRRSGAACPMCDGSGVVGSGEEEEAGSPPVALGGVAEALARLRLVGWRVVATGDGCSALEAMLRDGGWLWITDDGGCSAPDAGCERWALGRYDAEGELVGECLYEPWAEVVARVEALAGEVTP